MGDSASSSLHGEFSSQTLVSKCCEGCGIRFYARDGQTTCDRCAPPSLDERTATAATLGERGTLSEADALDKTLVTSLEKVSNHSPPLDVDSEVNEEQNSNNAVVEEFLSRIAKGVHVYSFESLLGIGGMGRVYLARHSMLERRCAVKVLSPQTPQGDQLFIKRFQQEGRAAASLNHPNIVVTHAIGEEQGVHFLEMEFVPGGSLRQLLRAQGPMPPLRATNIVRLIADGLANAHRVGIVHRDLKSDNVMMTLSGSPKITDFGLAKSVHTDAIDMPRALTGTPAYMAPELFSGEEATPASDVYALGVIYFELLTGEVPFSAETLSELQKTVQNDPIPNIRKLIPQMPLEMAECLAMLLDKCPKNRPADGAVAAQLLAAVAGNIPDLESLLQAAFADRPDVTWQRGDESYQLKISFQSGRKQFVTVEASSASAAEQLVIISSVCGPAAPSFYEEALRLNGMMPHGSITIQDVDGKPMFCAMNTYPRATTDPEEVRRSVFELAHRADSVERLLTSSDEF